MLRPALITTSAPQLSQPPNSPIHPPCHDPPPYSPHPLFSQLPTVPYTAHLATVLPTTASSPTHPLLRHFPLQPWPPSALPITTHHTLTTPTTRQVVIIASFPATAFPLMFTSARHPCIITKPHARPQGCQHRSYPLQIAFPSLLVPLAPKPTPSSSWRGP